MDTWKFMDICHISKYSVDEHIKMFTRNDTHINIFYFKLAECISRSCLWLCWKSRSSERCRSHNSVSLVHVHVSTYMYYMYQLKKYELSYFPPTLWTAVCMQVPYWPLGKRKSVTLSILGQLSYTCLSNSRINRVR